MNEYDELRRAINDRLRAAGHALPPIPGPVTVTNDLRLVQRATAWVPISDELLNPPEPTPEERERWEREAAEREAIQAERIASHPARVEAADSPLREVLELHQPVADGSLGPYCDGCDWDGYDAEHPRWPCRTYRLIAGWTEYD